MKVINFTKELEKEITFFHKEGMDKIRESFTITPEMDDLLNNRLVIEGSNLLRSCGGKAIMTKINSKYYLLRIKLNKKLHELNPNELRNTYLHELAHIIANLLKSSPQFHNDFWKEVMISMGLEPQIYHEMDVSCFKPKKRKFQYSCNSCSKIYNLTTMKHNKHSNRILNKERGYYCHCGSDLTFKQEI